MAQSLINTKRFFIAGLTAGLTLLVLYFVILSLANSFSHAREQFSQMWYWILILVTGFGLQIGLYFYIRTSFRLKQIAGSTTAVAASGGISTGSMIACCLHHLVDVLPLMGLAAAAVFLTQYQLLFIIVGTLSNLIGITIMLEIIQKHKLAEGFLRKFLVYDMARLKKIAVGGSLVLLSLSFILIKNSQAPATASVSSSSANYQSALEKKISLSSKTDSRGGVSFQVTPLEFNLNESVNFEIQIDTHSGSLDFDMTKISTLEDDKGNQYQPLEWQGSSSGGHHRSGTLTFPRVDKETNKIRLIIQDNFLRIFEWELK